MRWRNKDNPRIIITPRRYDRKSDEEKKNWVKFDENKVNHGDILNTILGVDPKNKDDDDG